MRDGQAQRVPEDGGDGEPVGAGADHGGLGARIDEAEDAVVVAAGEHVDDRGEHEQPGGDEAHLPQVTAALGVERRVHDEAERTARAAVARCRAGVRRCAEGAGFTLDTSRPSDGSCSGRRLEREGQRIDPRTRLAVGRDALPDPGGDGPDVRRREPGLAEPARSAARPHRPVPPASTRWRRHLGLAPRRPRARRATWASRWLGCQRALLGERPQHARAQHRRVAARRRRRPARGTPR